MLESIAHDLRYAVRQLRQSPGFTFIVALTLAAGIGANAAIFSVVDAVLLKPLGYRDAQRIFAIDTRFLQDRRVHDRIGGDDYADAAASLRTVQAAAYYSMDEGAVLIGVHGVYVKAAGVSRSFGEVLGVQPAAGRPFLKTGDIHTEAMVSSAFAREHFGAVSRAIGQVIAYDQAPITVVGVMPDGFSFPQNSAVWIGLADRPETPARDAYNQQAILRLRDGTTPAMLNAELATLSRRLAAAYPEDRAKELIAVPLQEQIVGKVRPVLRLLMGAVALVLLIVCANVTHLQMVRATAQEQRVALLRALGISRTRLVVGAAIQAMLLALMGGVGGVLLSLPLVKALVRLAPQDLPRLAELQQRGVVLNGDVLALCFGVSLLLMLLTAVVPVWRSWHVNPAGALKQDTARGLTSRGTSRLRGLLIVAEVALTFVLCIASSLLVQQMLQLSRVDLGFRPEHLLIADTHAPSSEHDGVNRVARLDALLASVEALPGVEAVGAIRGAPSKEAVDVGYAIRGRTEFRPGAHLAIANILPATPNYLNTMGLPLLRGRGLAETDRATMPFVAVITESMARQSFPGDNPVGKQIMCGFDSAGDWLTIVGVVADAAQESLAMRPGPTFYVPVAQHPRVAADMQIVVRTKSEPRLMLPAITQRIRAFDPAIAVTATTMRDSLSESVRLERFRSTLFGSFAVLSIVLAAVGVYGVTAYTVAQRRFEFGLRFAFGARRSQMFAGVLRSALGLTLMGIISGSAAALLLTRIAAALLTGVQPLQLVPWLVASSTVTALMLIASLVPARRAAAVNPMLALRAE